MGNASSTSSVEQKRKKCENIASRASFNAMKMDMDMDTAGYVPSTSQLASMANHTNSVIENSVGVYKYQFEKCMNE